MKIPLPIHIEHGLDRIRHWEQAHLYPEVIPKLELQLHLTTIIPKLFKLPVADEAIEGPVHQVQ